MTSPPMPRLSFAAAGPTCRADDLFWICDQLHAMRPGRPAPHPAEHQRPRQPHQPPDITPELAGRLDAVSVSLNGSDQEEYLRLTRPGAGGEGLAGHAGLRPGAAQSVPKVMVSIVDYDKSPQEIEACRKLAEDLGAIFQVRPFAG